MVSFRSGETYLYFGVSEPDYQTLISSNSPGTYFNTFIREGFPYRHIGGEDEFLAVIDPNQIGSSQVYMENPELEMGADWIVRAEDEGYPQEVIDSVVDNMRGMGLTNLKLQQLLNRARQEQPFSI